MSDGRSHRLLHVFPTFGPGGVALRMCDMMNRLGAAFSHIVLPLDGNDDCRSRLAPDTSVEFITLKFHKRETLANLARFAMVLRNRRPDLLLTYNWGAVEWGLVNRLVRVTPHIHFESGFGTDEAERQILRRVLFRRFALGRTERIVVPSRTLLRIATEIWRLDARRVNYIPNGVDATRFSGAVIPRPLPGFEKQPNELVIGTVAPLRPEKNLARLLHSFAALGSSAITRLLIVGDGPERPSLENLARSFGVEDRVFFAGHIDAPETVLGWFDVFALSSDTEQMPNAVLQAMSAARPIAAVDVGDVKEIVSLPNRSFVVSPHDKDGFRSALETLLSSERLRRELGAANRAHVIANYTMDRMVENYRQIFEDAVAGLTPRGAKQKSSSVSSSAIETDAVTR